MVDLSKEANLSIISLDSLSIKVLKIIDDEF